jgi:two-component sensor histidine kinase/tetratricopeptide (TPR) repeat protein
MRKNLLTYLIVFFSLSNLFAQFDKDAFLKQFYKSDYKEKVRLVANIDFNDIKDIYPQIKDTLDKIKKFVYTQTSSNEAKFLFDLIEAKEAMYNAQFPKCISILNNALQYHCDNINDSLKSMLLLKECLLKINDYNKALEIHKLIEKNWNRKTIALWIGTPKSTIYSYLGIYKYAIAERRREYENGSHDHWETAKMYNDIGVFYNRMQKYDSAEVNFKRALKELSQIDKKNKDTNYYNFFVSLIKSNLAVGLLKTHRYKEAIPYLLIDVRNSLANKEYESVFNAYLGLIEAYINLNNLSLAKRYLDTLDLLDIPEFRYPNNVVKKYYWKSFFYEKSEDIHKSLDFLKQYVKLKDSVLEHEKQLKAINAEIAYNVQEKDNALKEKTMALSILKLEQEKSNTIKTYLIIFIIILLIAGFILFKYYREAQKHSEELEKSNQLIQQQNQTIQKSLKEKEMLIKEIHHRVKNNLQIINSIIRLQMSKEKSENAQTLLNEISARIQSIALTHQMLYKKDQFLHINAAEYLRHLCEQTISAFSDNTNIQLHLKIDADNLELPLDTAIPLGLICSEVITNAIKYAFPNKKGKIEVSFHCDEKNCTLIIKDNGIGIDLNKIDKSESLGIELIKLLSEQIDGQYSYKVDNGTIFQLVFNKPKN